MGVPEHRAEVVEALGAQRLADNRVTLGMAASTRERSAVRAGAGAAPRSARAGCIAHDIASVHRPERRGGQSHEELGVGDHRRADPLAAADARSDELPGVGLVEARARRADGGAPVLAHDDQVALDQLSARAVQGEAPQADRMGAQAGLVDLGEDSPPLGGGPHCDSLVGCDRRATARWASSAMASSSRKWVRTLRGTAPSANR